jgi:hypothetical protein
MSEVSFLVDFQAINVYFWLIMAGMIVKTVIEVMFMKEV